MQDKHEFAKVLLDGLADLLEIPPSHYQRAVDRFNSLGDWLDRPQSKVAALDPRVYSQGSFRYGTVIRPLLQREEYDLDLVCEIALQKDGVTQRQVKDLVGDEVKSYADAYNFSEPAEEKRRCWRLKYAVEVSFHMDILPSIPEDPLTIHELAQAAVAPRLAAMAVAITDKTHANYDAIAKRWPSSNPRGYATWFEDQMRGVAAPRQRELVARRVYASVEAVPVYAWRTPLQRSIQVLKRHRDVMFAGSPNFKPISMIITTLAARAYQGESDLKRALTTIVARMPEFVQSSRPRVENPVNRAEDFADQWAQDPLYEQNFWAWHRQVSDDFANLGDLAGRGSDEPARAMRNKFKVDLPADLEERLSPRVVVPASPRVTRAPEVVVAVPPKPWRPYA